MEIILKNVLKHKIYVKIIVINSVSKFTRGTVESVESLTVIKQVTVRIIFEQGIINDQEDNIIVSFM